MLWTQLPKLSLTQCPYLWHKGHSPQPDVNSWWWKFFFIKTHCFYSHLAKSEVQSQSSTTRVQLLWSVRPFLFRRDFSKVSAKYFRQRNPAVKILLTFAQLLYVWIYFYLHFSAILGSVVPLPSFPPSPSFTLAAPHGSFEKWQFLSLILMGHKCSASQHTLD